jgi:hypothetical protein
MRLHGAVARSILWCIAKRRCEVSALVAASPELKRLWIRVLKRVHPSLAVDEQDRRRFERLTQQANDAFARRDELALRAVLGPKDLPLARHAPPDAWYARAQAQPATPPQSTYQPPLAPQQPPAVIGREVFGVLCAAGAVLCLLLYGIFDALREEVGRMTSLSLLVLLTAAVLWWISKHAKLSYTHKARWMVAVASGMILVAICLLESGPRKRPLFPSARAATAQALAAAGGLKGMDTASPFNAYRPQSNIPQTTPTVMTPSPKPVESLASQLTGYTEAVKNKVAQKWDSSEVTGTTPAGATVYIQFAVRRRGNHGFPTVETPSGYLSLDVSCLGAVDRIQTFDPLPKSYGGDSLTVLYHCTYPGSTTTGPAPTKLAQDSTLPPAQTPPPSGH